MKEQDTIIAITIEGKTELVSRIYELSQELEVEKSEPIQRDSLVEPLDSPLGADEVREIVEILTVMFNFGSAFLGFTAVLLKTLKEFPNENLIIRNPRTGEKVGELDSDSTDSEIKEITEKIR